jgi:4-hydroxybenzoate polyprenyltransferase
MVLLMGASSAVFGGTWAQVLLVLVASAAGQATIGWTNDAHDSAADVAAGRLTKPTVQGVIRPEELRLPIVVSATLTVPLSFVAAGWIGGFAHIAAVASALMYNFFLARTAWSWLPYAVSFALMPLFVAQAISPARWPTVSLMGLSVLVGLIAHLLNAIPDINADRDSGWGGLAVSLGRRRSQGLVAVLICVAVVLVTAIIRDFYVI